jgi:RNA polymerase sigma-70 factor (ECF subfamily)
MTVTPASTPSTPHAPKAPAPLRTGFAIDVPATLIRQARQGDAAAFEQLYRWFERPVFTLALRLTGQREDAQDILQDTMLKLLDKLGEFRGDAPFWGWLRQIAVNEALMRLRKRGRLQLEADAGEHEYEAADTLLPPEAADAAVLGQALAALPDTTRSVLWLYHAEGYTHDEIAGAMGRTVSFSKSQLARGTRKLRALLAIDQEAIAHG